MTATLNPSDLRITTVFKNNRNNSYFKNIEEEKNAEKFMIYNKNEKECWASIATLPSQIMSIVEQKRYVVNKRKVIIKMLVMKEQMSLEDCKKASIRLMKLYEKELYKFCSEKLNISITGTLIF